MNVTLNQLFTNERDLHILYTYLDLEDYKRQCLAFIEDGISAGEYVIVIENERLTTLLRHELTSRFSRQKLETIHFVNSLFFYRSTGSYNPSSIIKYYKETIRPYIEKDVLFRSWAHVEWSSADEPFHLIRDCETVSEDIVTQYSFPQVCAYDKNRMPAALEKLLRESHSYVLDGNE